jgi:protein phosphatase
MRMVARTNQGKVRDNNEDFYALNADKGIAVLADGMGGLKAGEVAAEEAVRVTMERLVQAVDGGGLGDGAANVLREAITEANRVVHALADSRYDYQGMGTTLVCAVLTPAGALVGHVGDSRAYRFNAGDLTRVTTDHSLVQQLVDEGVLSVEEAQRAPNRNIVTRAIGIEPEVAVDTSTVPIDDGDLLLLCTDGLTDLVSDAELVRLCAGYADALDELVDELVNAALTRGGIDNVSVVVIAT